MSKLTLLKESFHPIKRMFCFMQFTVVMYKIQMMLTKESIDSINGETNYT